LFPENNLVSRHNKGFSILTEIGLNGLVAVLVVLCLPAVVTILVLDRLAVDAVECLSDTLPRAS
jgi:hypothetical protein